MENDTQNQNNESNQEDTLTNSDAENGILSKPEDAERGHTKTHTTVDDSPYVPNKETDPFVFYDPANHQEGSSDDLPTFILMRPLDKKLLDQLIVDIANNENLTDKEKAEAASAIGEAIHLRFTDDAFMGLTEAPADGWTQIVEVDGKKVATRVSKMKEQSGRLSGVNAIQYVNNLVGSGVTVFVPLWNSGFNVTIGNIKESEVQGLIAKLQMAKKELGYQTRGAIFTGDDVVVTGIVFDFFLSHIVTTSLKENEATPEMLRELILVSDIQPILAALLTSIYVKGYPIIHTCINVAQKKCSYGTTIEVDEKTNEFKYHSLLEFMKTTWIDRKKLTDADIRQVNASRDTTEPKDIIAYQERHLGKSEVLSIKEPGTPYTYKFIGRHPNVHTYLESGESWINSVRSVVNQIINEAEFDNRKDREDRRYETLLHFAKTKQTGRHLPWIKEIVIVNTEDPEAEEVIIDSQEPISTLLSENFSGKYSEEIANALVKFKERATLSVVGITNYKCPECGSGQTSANSPHPSLIPINMLHYFFVIGEWRYRKIESR